MPIAEEVARYAVRLAAATRPRRPGTPEFVNEWVRWGAGLRAAQFLVLGAKARALLAGRFHVAPDDIQALALPVLRHRVLLSYRAEAEGVTRRDGGAAPAGGRARALRTTPVAGSDPAQPAVQSLGLRAAARAGPRRR